MSRLAVPFTLAATFVLTILSAVPNTLAGPACARRYWQTEDCLTKCIQNWGWPGSAMGTDRWGSVMKPASQDAAAILSQACGFSTTASPSSTPSATQPGVVVPSATATPSAIVVQAPAPSPTPETSSADGGPSSTASDSTSPSATSSTTPSPDTPTVTPSVQEIATSTSSTPQANEAPATPSPTTTTDPTTSSSPATSPETTITSSPSPSPSTSPSSQPNQANTGGSSSSSSTTTGNDIDQYLSAHNSVRAQHGASALTWSDNLASKAQQWANGCVFQHSGGSLGPFGENLAAGTGSSYGIAAAVGSWTAEVSQYDPSNPQPSHFTQVVWKGTSQVGCAVQTCAAGTIFPANDGPAQFFVCEYEAQGNIIGEFVQNVQV
ncbi:hypothetical protein JAAARDRAFT_29854 [Jaapia argillacea MUCL 33604]|uniref:SCP domain-containing protein n=1 Tax=Jaapia argillacea MUCL 33604 TaxID=933084 RepID=A0A067Q9S7_9AGAM|nr:hypothetical protein JAAARDRAFT_29854 [Jaapia argillacea MUCL 33604]